MHHIGIDPGSSGGLACLDSDGRVVGAVPMPPTHPEILAQLEAWKYDAIEADGPVAFIEHVHAFPGQMGMFSFGKNVGHIEMALTVAGIAFLEVAPIRWQNALDCRTGGKKNISKAKAQELFPDVKITHAIADCLLIAEYGRRLHRGMFAAPVGRK